MDIRERNLYKTINRGRGEELVGHACCARVQTGVWSPRIHVKLDTGSLSKIPELPREADDDKRRIIKSSWAS